MKHTTGCQLRGRARANLLRLLLLAVLVAGPAALGAAHGAPATLVVATADSSDHSRAAADHVGDGTGDQEEINAERTSASNERLIRKV